MLYNPLRGVSLGIVHSSANKRKKRFSSSMNFCRRCLYGSGDQKRRIYACREWARRRIHGARLLELLRRKYHIWARYIKIQKVFFFFFFPTIHSRDFRGLVISHYWSGKRFLLLWIPYTSGASSTNCVTKRNVLEKKRFSYSDKSPQKWKSVMNEMKAFWHCR